MNTLHPFNIKFHIKNFGFAYAFWNLTTIQKLSTKRALYLITIATFCK